MSGNSLRQTVHTHRASVYQAAKLVPALLRVAGVTAGLAESNGSLQPGLWLTSPAGWLPRTGISSGTLRSAIEYRLPFTFLSFACAQKLAANQLADRTLILTYRIIFGSVDVCMSDYFQLMFADGDRTVTRGSLTPSSYRITTAALTRGKTF